MKKRHVGIPHISDEIKKHQKTKLKRITKRCLRQIAAARKAARYANIKEYEKARLLNLNCKKHSIVIRGASSKPNPQNHIPLQKEPPLYYAPIR